MMSMMSTHSDKCNQMSRDGKERQSAVSAWFTSKREISRTDEFEDGDVHFANTTELSNESNSREENLRPKLERRSFFKTADNVNCISALAICSFESLLERCN
ncbi:hypothetical protein TorRG33x02_130060, partial [Trema orientale]